MHTQERLCEWQKGNLVKHHDMYNDDDHGLIYDGEES